MDKKITFTGKMDEKDFNKLFYYQTLSKLFFIIPAYFAIFATLLCVLKIYTSLDLSLFLIAILSFCSSIIFIFIYISLLYRRLRKEFLQDLSNIKEQQYLIDEEKISILVEGRKTDILYKDLKKIKNSRFFFVLYHKANVMIAIPKRFINNDDISVISEIFDKVK